MEDPEEEALKKEEEAKKWVRQVLENGFYTKAKLLACGGMGAAFRVTVKDHSERALKIALPSEDGSGDVFLKEARVANKLVHHCFFGVDVINIIYMSFLERSVSSFVGSLKLLFNNSSVHQFILFPSNDFDPLFFQSYHRRKED